MCRKDGRYVWKDVRKSSMSIDSTSIQPVCQNHGWSEAEGGTVGHKRYIAGKWWSWAHAACILCRWGCQNARDGIGWKMYRCVTWCSFVTCFSPAENMPHFPRLEDICNLPGRFATTEWYLLCFYYMLLNHVKTRRDLCDFNQQAKRVCIILYIFAYVFAYVCICIICERQLKNFWVGSLWAGRRTESLYKGDLMTLASTLRKLRCFWQCSIVAAQYWASIYTSHH